MTTEKTITISLKEYNSLQLDSYKLMLLENGGVDNWEWYGESLYPEDTNVMNIDQYEESLEK